MSWLLTTEFAYGTPVAHKYMNRYVSAEFRGKQSHTTGPCTYFSPTHPTGKVKGNFDGFMIQDQATFTQTGFLFAIIKYIKVQSIYFSVD